MARKRKSSPEIYGNNNVLALAVTVTEFLREEGWPFCIIGGVAVLRWGEPRQTTDVDGVVFAGFGHEDTFANRFLARFQPRIDDPVNFAQQYRILLMESDDGIGIDVSLGGLPYEQRLVERASDWQVPGHGPIRTCSAEDLIVLKCIANRPLDRVDIERIVTRQGKRLDRRLVIEELRPLAEMKEDLEIPAWMEECFHRISPS